MLSTVLDWSDPPPAECRGGAVTIGNFDGVHLGHQALLTATCQAAQSLCGPAVVLSFDPPPLRLLAPHRPLERLVSVADRDALLQSLGLDRLLLLRTTPQLLALSAEVFFEEVLVRRLRVRSVVEGFNFRFGHDRAGDVSLLERLCLAAEVAFTRVAPVIIEGEPVSSSRIRAGLHRGDVALVGRMLGRPYRLRGRVASGQQRGHTLGYPTANLCDVEILIPGDGVYAVRGITEEGTSYAGAAHIGPNPTFGESARKVEVHLIGFHGQLYGQQLTVDFLDRLRDTQSFASVEALLDQMRRDVARAEALAAENPSWIP